MKKFFSLTFNVLLLAGCGAPATVPAPELPTATNTPMLPTVTSTPAPPTIAELLIGNWQPLSKGQDAMFLQINSDGTCRQSYKLEGLTSVPQVECTYTFEGTNILFTVVKLNGVPECPSPTGAYEVRLVADDQIELVAKKDSCAPRIRSTRGVYQRIP